jgi:hypothetical protein
VGFSLNINQDHILKLKLSNAAKVIEASEIKFILEKNAEAGAIENPAPGKK